MTHRSHRLGLAVLVLAATMPTASAAPYTWTTSGSGSVLTDGPGTWNTSALNWTTTGAGAAVAWPNLTTDIAVFGVNSGAAGTVTVGAVSTNGITFNQPGSGSYLLSGGTISFGGTNPTITTGSGVSAAIASPATSSSGLITGGGGILTMSGSVRLASTGTFTVGNGEVVLASGAVVSNAQAFSVGTDVVGGTATLRIKSGGSLSLLGTNQNSIIGTASAPWATVVQEGGSVTISGTPGNSGAVVMGQGGTTTYSGSSSYSMQGGSLTLSNTNSGYLSVGRNAPATFTQSGGTVTLGRTSDVLILGDYSSGSYEMSGGSLTASSTSANAILGNRGGTGTLTITNSGSFGIAGSMFLAVNGSNSATDKGSATINLQGGDLAVNGMTRGRTTGSGTTGSNGPGTATFNFSGGTLRPFSANTSIGSASGTSNFSISLSGTGATLSGIDRATAASRTLDVYATLDGTGNITVSGGLVNLRGTNTLTGLTSIAAGGTAALLGTSASSSGFRVNGTLDLSSKTSGFTFGSGQTVSGTGLITIGSGVTVTSNGIWAPGNSIGSNSVTGNLTLSGTSQFELGTPGSSTSSPGNSDFTAVSGTLTLGGNLQLIDNAGANALGSAAGGVYRLFTYGNAVSGSFASVTTNPTPTTRTSLSNISYGGSGTAAGNGVFLSVYNLAAAGISSGTSLNLGTVLKNTSLSQALTISNTAPSGSYSEKLDAAFGSVTGLASGSGSVSLLAAGDSSSALSISLASGSAGLAQGTAQINFTSNGDGTSGLGTASLGSQTVSLTATVLDPALASFASGSAATTSWTVDFGSVNQNAGVSPLGFSLFNLMQTSGFTADLALIDIDSTAATNPELTTSLSSTFSSLLAGSSNAYTASFSTATLGSFENVYVLRFKSSNNGTVYTADSTQDLTLTVKGIVVVPEPQAVVLAGVGAAAAAWLFRRRRSPRG